MTVVMSGDRFYSKLYYRSIDVLLKKKKSSEYFSITFKDQLLKGATSQVVYLEKFSLNLSSSSIISDCNMVD